MTSTYRVNGTITINVNTSVDAESEEEALSLAMFALHNEGYETGDLETEPKINHVELEYWECEECGCPHREEDGDDFEPHCFQGAKFCSSECEADFLAREH